MWGRCRSCEAKDREIEHLLALADRLTVQTEKAQARLAELAQPGLTQRIEPRAPRALVPVAAATGRPAIQFPGYEGGQLPPGAKVEVD